MAEKILNTRIQLKYDSYTNWTTNDPVLKKGEVAVVEIPTGTSSTGLTPPAIGIKIGDGTSKFTALNWTQALAGDVYAWAKASTKPTYTATEIDGLSGYISDAIKDTDTQYKIEKYAADATVTLDGATEALPHLSTGSTYILYSKSLTAETWTPVSSFDVVDTDTTYNFSEGTTDGTISVTPVTNGTAGTAQEIAVHGLGSAAYTDSTAYAAKSYETTVDTLVGSDTGKSARTIANEEIAAQLIPADAKESLDTLQEIAAWIQSHPDDASAMNARIAVLKDVLSDYVSETDGVYTKTASLAAIAKSGNVNDLEQTEGDVLVLDCGTSENV